MQHFDEGGLPDELSGRRSRLQAPSSSPPTAAQPNCDYSHLPAPALPSTSLHSIRNKCLSSKMAAAAPPVGSPTPRIAHLCDVVLENLRSLAADPSSSLSADNHNNDAVKAFRNEIQTFRKFLDLIERVRRANAPRMAFEEDHVNDIKALLERCRATLSRLCELLAAMRGRNYEAASSPGPSRELRWDLNAPEISALRTRMGFYTQTLQMSLQTVKLYAL